MIFKDKHMKHLMKTLTLLAGIALLPDYAQAQVSETVDVTANIVDRASTTTISGTPGSFGEIAPPTQAGNTCTYFITTDSGNFVRRNVDGSGQNPEPDVCSLGDIAQQALFDISCLPNTVLDGTLTSRPTPEALSNGMGFGSFTETNFGGEVLEGGGIVSITEIQCPAEGSVLYSPSFTYLQLSSETVPIGDIKVGDITLEVTF